MRFSVKNETAADQGRKGRGKQSESEKQGAAAVLRVAVKKTKFLRHRNGRKDVPLRGTDVEKEKHQ